MSVLVDDSYANPTTSLWTNVSSSVGGSFADTISLNTLGTITLSSGTPVQLGKVVFPSPLTKNAFANGCIYLQLGSSVSGSLYISSSSTGSITGCNSFSLSSPISNFYYLDGLSCPASGASTIYLWFNPSSSQANTTGSSSLTQFTEVNYSSMPTRAWNISTGSTSLATISGI